MAGSTQLTMPGGEPRYTKIRGQNRYYDHALGKSISHRQYWKLKGQQRERDKWTPAKAASISKRSPAQPSPVRAAPAPLVSQPGGPNVLAQQLLAESRLDSLAGSPIVETPPAPGSVARELAEELAEDTKKSVHSLAETFAPVLGAILILLGVWLVPEWMRWLVPEQEEAELVLSPALRIMFRYFGFTGKALGENGSDVMSLIMALGAYAIGTKERLDEYLEAIQEEQEADDQPTSTADAYRRAGRSDTSRAHTAPPPDVNGASPAAYANIFGTGRQQSNQAASQQAAPAHARPRVEVTTERQAADAAKIRDLFEADYTGRKLMGLAR